MFKKILNIILPSIIFFGCAGTIQEKIYLQEVEVSGPINHPPVRVTQNRAANQVTFSPKLFINTEKKIDSRISHSKVNERGIYQVDTISIGPDNWTFRESLSNRYDYKGKNLHWNLPDAYFGVDMDFPLSRTLSLAGSLNFSSVNNQELIGGSVGFGLSKEGQNSAFRFDFGVSFQEYAFDAETVVITTYSDFGSQATDIIFYHDVNKNKDVNLYGSVTINSISKTSFNYFVTLSYFSQTLLDFEPTENNPEYYFWGPARYTSDLRGEASTSYLSISPGIYHNLSKDIRLLLGFSLLKDLGMEESSESIIILPVLKFDLLF